MARRLSGLSLGNLLLGGWSSLVFVFLYAPILVLVVYSFNASRLAAVWEGFSLEWYAALGRELGDHVTGTRRSPLVAAAFNSVVIAAVVSVISVVLGTGGAWLLHRYRFPGLRAITTLVHVPVILPEIILGISLLLLFRSVSLPLGFTTVILSHVTFCFPFVLLAVQARLAGVDPALEEAALDLGATPLKAFFLVMVPYMMPAIVAGGLMAFTLSLDEVIVTHFTRGPTSETLPLHVYGLARVGLSPLLNVLSAVFIVVTAALAVAAGALQRRTP